MTRQTIHPQHPYRGRFAPSPTGPLHFGSLVAAVGSYLDAKSQRGEWLVRVEDLDPPRQIPGAADDILRTLEAYRLFWDGPVLFQSQRHEAYEEALNQLAQQGDSYPCACSRKSIAENRATSPAKTGTRSDIYPGTCRDGLAPGTTARSIRLRVLPEVIEFNDQVQGQINIQVDKEVGDFVIKRADGFYAYHLAVVVDDAHQDITHIVRGIDLISSTSPHLCLQKSLGLNTPQYAHLPIAVNTKGEKLSKQTHAKPVDCTQPGETLSRVLSFLGHTPDSDVICADPETLIDWALTQWDLSNVPADRAIPAE